MDAASVLTRATASLSMMESTVFDQATFADLGVVVIRNAVEQSAVDEWVSHWRHHREGGDANLVENPSNPVEVKRLPEPLAQLAFDERIVKYARDAFGENVGLFHNRFVVKNNASSGAIMLHQDSGYHTGSLDKASFFVALAPVSRANGAMYLYPGTHRFGYLGDAGEIDPTVLPDNWPVASPKLEPGDLMIMDSRTWHGSYPFLNGPDRVMTDFIYQHGDDPSSIATVCGDGWSGSFLTENRGKIFKTSRSLKLRQIRAALDSTTN